jgi:hypothetical protein
MLTLPWYYQPAISDPYQSEALRRKFFGNARSADPVLVRATRDSNFWHLSQHTVCNKVYPPTMTPTVDVLWIASARTPTPYGVCVG